MFSEEERRVFNLIDELYKGDIRDRSMAFDLEGVLANECLDMPYAERLQFIEERVEEYRRLKGTRDSDPWLGYPDGAMPGSDDVLPEKPEDGD